MTFVHNNLSYSATSQGARTSTLTVHTPAGTTIVTTSASTSLVSTASSVLPAVVPIAMRLGLTMNADDLIGSLAAANAEKAVNVLASWFSELSPIRLPRAASHGNERSTAGRGVGAFFSGGVDSFYTALEQGDRISHLILFTASTSTSTTTDWPNARSPPRRTWQTRSVRHLSSSRLISEDWPSLSTSTGPDTTGLRWATSRSCSPTTFTP